MAALALNNAALFPQSLPMSITAAVSEEFQVLTTADRAISALKFPLLFRHRNEMKLKVLVAARRADTTLIEDISLILVYLPRRREDRASDPVIVQAEFCGF